jgi:hypothetical protein
MTRKFSCLFAANFLLFFFAFAEVKESPKWKGIVEKKNDIIVVKNPKEPIFLEEVISLDEELSIGGAEGKAEYAFSEIRHLAVDEKERIFVLDYKESQIRVFDKNGNYLQTIGKKGQGPGELDRPRMIALNQDELMALELGQRRLSFFSLEGQFLRSLSTKEFWTLSARIDSAGNIIITEGLMDPQNPSYRVIKFDSQMNLKKEIASSPAPNASKGFNPFMPVHYWVVDKSDNIIYGYPEKYEIQVFNPEGEVIKKITREYEAVEVAEDEKEERMKDAPTGIKFIFSKYHSAFQRFVVDDEGRIAVMTWEKAKGKKNYVHDIFDPQGRFLTKVALPTRPIALKKNKLYTIEEDPEGYQIIKRYQVNWKS